MMKNLNINGLVSGGVITNYHCVSRCGHCLYNCGPERSRDYLEGVRAEEIFRRILDLGCRSVHIGGGEPLLHPQKLLDVLAAARRVGVGIDYVETNSAWYKDGDQAEAVLRDLLSAGVETLLVSISPFHNAFIPYDRVMGVMAACRKVGMAIFPWVSAFVRDLTRMDVHRTHPMEDFESAYGAGYMGCIPDRYWIHLGGRALKTFSGVYALRPAETVVANSPMSCLRALSDTSHFHIDLHGHYVPGLCAGLVIDMADLGEVLPEGKYILLEHLARGGIRQLVEFAGEAYGFHPRREGYLSHCDLCTEVRGFLHGLKAEIYAELGPAGFYA